MRLSPKFFAIFLQQKALKSPLYYIPPSLRKVTTLKLHCYTLRPLISMKSSDTATRRGFWFNLILSRHRSTAAKSSLHAQNKWKISRKVFVSSFFSLSHTHILSLSRTQHALKYFLADPTPINFFMENWWMVLKAAACWYDSALP